MDEVFILDVAFGPEWHKVNQDDFNDYCGRFFDGNGSDPPEQFTLDCIAGIVKKVHGIKAVVVGPVLRTPIEKISEETLKLYRNCTRKNDGPMPGTVHGEWLQDDRVIFLSYGVDRKPGDINLHRTAWHEVFHAARDRLSVRQWLACTNYGYALDTVEDQPVESCADAFAAYAAFGGLSPALPIPEIVADAWDAIIDGDYAHPEFNIDDVPLPPVVRTFTSRVAAIFNFMTWRIPHAA